MGSSSVTQILEIPQISVLILAGGKGTRLRGVVSDRPKVLAPVDGHPWLSYLLRQIEIAGVRKVTLCTGYMADQVEQAFGSHFGELEIQYSVESSPLGTAGAIRQALSLCEHPNILVLNGDSYCEFELARLYAFHAARKAKATIVVSHVQDASRFGQVKAESDGKITGFLEKQENLEAGWINAGVYLLSRELIEAIPSEREFSIEKECFPNWIGESFYAYPSDSEKFLDIGIPESFAAAQSFVRTLSKG